MFSLTESKADDPFTMYFDLTESCSDLTEFDRPIDVKTQLQTPYLDHNEFEKITFRSVKRHHNTFQNGIFGGF